MIQEHPFIASMSEARYVMPPQMLSNKEKEENKDSNGVSAWKRRNMDSQERFALDALRQNQYLTQNEKIVNGEFIPQDYIEDCKEEGFLNPINELSKDGGLPKFIKHYDWISSAIKTQVQEFTQLPDTFNIVGSGDLIENEVLEYKKDLLTKHFQEMLEIRFNKILESNQMDPAQEFESPEQEQAFQQKVEELRKTNTPAEIGKLFKYSFRHFAEEWAEEELKDQKERYRLEKLRRKEFFNYLVVGRRFRFVNATKRGLQVEYLNYANVYYHKSANIDYIQDGNYAGYIDVLSSSDVINKYGHLMTEADIRTFDSLYARDSKTDYPNVDFFGNKVDYLDASGLPYSTIMPSYSPIINALAPNLGMNWVAGTNVNEFLCTTAYWKGFKKIGRLAWINPETGLLEIKKVDESFVVPKWIEILPKGTFNDEPIENTIVWAWEEVIYGGIKIRNRGFNNVAPLYLEVGEREFQAASEYQLGGKKLPILGQVSNNTNTKENSQVSMVKPYIFLYNIAMNKAMKYMEKTLASFLAVELRNIPSLKDYDGSEPLFDWLDGADRDGIAILDTAPTTTQGANSGGQLPKVIDVDNSAKAIQHFNIANSIRMLGLNQLGMSPERLGDMTGVDSATGINVGLVKSHNATGSWFTEFFECEKEILQYQLDAAQWLQSRKKDFSSYLNRGIITDSYLLANSGDFSLYDLRVYISNSQEELRKLEVFRKLAEMNTSPTAMSTRMQMMGKSNPELIIQIVKDEEDKQLAFQQKSQELEFAKQAATDEQKKMELEFEKEKLYATLKNNLEEAFIKSRGYLGAEGQDLDNSGTLDAFEYEKFEAQSSINTEKNEILRDKLELDKQKQQSQKIKEQRDYNLKLQEIQTKRLEYLQKLEIAKYQDKGTYKK